MSDTEEKEQPTKDSLTSFTEDRIEFLNSRVQHLQNKYDSLRHEVQEWKDRYVRDIAPNALEDEIESLTEYYINNLKSAESSYLLNIQQVKRKLKEPYE